MTRHRNPSCPYWFLGFLLGALVGVLLGGVRGVAAEPAHLDVRATATSAADCEHAEIRLEVVGDGDPSTVRRPLDVMLVLDRSGSMDDAGGSPPEPITSAKNAAKLLVDTLDPAQDQVGLVSYATTASLDRTLTSNLAAVKTAIDALVVSGYTNIGDGAYDAQAHLVASGRPAPAVRAMIVLSDAIANRSHAGQTCSTTPTTPTICTADAVNQAAAARLAGTTVFTIGLNLDNIDEPTQTVARNTLIAMASSPETYYEAPDASDLEDIFASIATSISNLAGSEVVATYTLTPGVAYVSGSASPEPTGISGQTLTWNLGSIALEEVASMTFLVRIDPYEANKQVALHPDSEVDYNEAEGVSASATFPILNVDVNRCPTPTPTAVNTGVPTATATRTSSPTDTPPPTPPPTSTPTHSTSQTPAGTPNLTPTVNSTPTQAPCGIEMSLRKRHAGVSNPGSEITFTVLWANPCPEPALGVVVTDALPEGLSLVSAWSDDADVVISSDVVTFIVGTLYRGPSGTGTIVARIDSDTPDGALLRNVAMLTDIAGHDVRAEDTLRVRSPTFDKGRFACFLRAHYISTPDQHVTYIVRWLRGKAPIVVSLEIPQSKSLLTTSPRATLHDGNTFTWTDLPDGSRGKVKVTVTSADQDCHFVCRGAHAMVTDVSGREAVCDHETGVYIHEKAMQILLKGPRQVRAGGVTTLIARYRHVAPGDNRLTLTLPPGCRIDSVFPEATHLDGSVLTWEDLDTESGHVQATAYLPADAKPGTAVAASASLSDASGLVVHSTLVSEVRVITDDTQTNGPTLSVAAQRTARPGSAVTYTLRYRHAPPVSRIELHLPEFLTVQSVMPQGIVDDTSVAGDGIEGTSGTLKVNVQVDPEAPVNAVLAAIADMHLAGSSETPFAFSEWSTQVVPGGGSSDPGVATLSLTGVKSVKPGLKYTLTIKYAGAGAVLRAGVPTELTMQQTPPLASVGAGGVVTWNGLKAGSGTIKLKVAVNPVTPTGTLLTVPGTLSVGDRILAEGLWDAQVRH